MPDKVRLELAKVADANRIATMSRNLIEAGLGWSWTPGRVARQIRCPDTVVLTARTNQCLIGFAIMHFRHEDAYLNLLAVRPPHQNAGIGRRLVRWLEKSAEVAGISTIHLEVRAKNQSARAFYRALGYRDTSLAPGYYRGLEAAIRMAHHIRETRWSQVEKEKQASAWKCFDFPSREMPD